MSKETDQLQRIVEGALMAAGKPLTIQQLINLFHVDEQERPTKEQLITALEDIQQDCRGRGFELKEVSSGFRFQVVQDVAEWVSRLWDEKPQKYSRALLETLSLIAYRQPITRGDIENIRGVAVSSHIVKTLLEREWVRVVGHKDVPGRPALYATTRGFLDYFNLKNLDGLPSLAEIRDLDNMNEELALEGADTPNTAELDNTITVQTAATEQLDQDPDTESSAKESTVDDNASVHIVIDSSAVESIATDANVDPVTEQILIQPQQAINALEVEVEVEVEVEDHLLPETSR